jgi:hypothetical protein
MVGPESPPRGSSRWRTVAEVLGALAAVATVAGLVVRFVADDKPPAAVPPAISPTKTTDADRNFRLYWDGSVRFTLNGHVDLDQRPPGPTPVEDNWGISGPESEFPEGALLSPRQGGIASWGPSRPPTPAECRTVLAQGKRHIYGFTPAPSYLCLITPEGRLARLQYVSRNGVGYQTYYEFQITLWLIQ